MAADKKTVKELYDEFCAKFSIDEVSKSIELSMIYKHLQFQCSISNGQYVHDPGPRMKRLLMQYLELDKSKEPCHC